MSTLAESRNALINKWRSEGIGDDLLRAFAKVPREEFVPAEVKGYAYMDQPLLIGYGQTISQPSTIMNMLRLLQPSCGSRVLEIGAGSGYVCALLAALGCDVVGVEILPELSVMAAKTVNRIGFGGKIAMHTADAGGGWEQDAPFDRILVSASFSDVPRHLVDQIADGGRMVVPVGLVEQRMLLLRKEKDGGVVEEDHGAYVFVPITGKFGEERHNDVPGMPFV